MDKGLVSIIIPIYNVEKYLDNCIRSACEQTYTNVEIILVDDGSTDSSPKICDKWASMDKRIVVVHKENGGLSSARNAGLDIAKGEYIFFLDGDDTVQKEVLTISLANMLDDVDLVVFGYNLVYDDGRIVEVKFPSKDYNLRTKEERVDFTIGPFFKYETGWNAWNRIFQKSIIDEFNLRFEDNKRILAEDQYFCLVYNAHCHSIAVLEDCLYDYYQRQDSIMGTIRNKKIYNFGKKNELAVALLEHYKKFNDCECYIDVFPIIHYLLIEKEVKIVESFKDYSANNLRKMIIDNINEKSDLAFFFDDLKSFPDFRKTLSRVYDVTHILEKCGRAKWLLKGHSFWYTVLVKFRKGIKRNCEKNTDIDRKF